MIVTRLFGGLGNQMFQYAAGLSLAQRRRTTLKLDVSWFREETGEAPHASYGMNCFRITEQFATYDEIWPAPQQNVRNILSPFRSKPAPVQPEKPKGWHTPPTFRFYPEFFELPDDTYLDGHFQAEQFFAPVAGLLRLQFSFRYDPPPHLTPLVREIEACPRSVAMHFRRGDYAVDPRYSTQNGVLTLDYYERAVDEFQERLGDFTLYIFSDDIEAIAQEFRPSIPHHFVKEVQPWHSFDEIRLMSLCEHIVMANSTFSWWAAWLNSSPEKIVIAPAPWFLGGIHNDSDVIPASWLKLAR